MIWILEFWQQHYLCLESTKVIKHLHKCAPLEILKSWIAGQRTTIEKAAAQKFVRVLVIANLKKSGVPTNLSAIPVWLEGLFRAKGDYKKEWGRKHDFQTLLQGLSVGLKARPSLEDRRYNINVYVLAWNYRHCVNNVKSGLRRVFAS